MLADLTTSKLENGNQVTILLGDGRRIVGRLLDDHEDIQVVENTTSLSSDVAQCAVGIAYVYTHEEGVDRMPWRRLATQADRCNRDLTAARMKLN